MQKLTPHGQTREACEWVLKNYSNHPNYDTNKTTRLWLESSRKQLDLLKDQE